MSEYQVGVKDVKHGKSKIFDVHVTLWEYVYNTCRDHDPKKPFYIKLKEVEHATQTENEAQL